MKGHGEEFSEEELELFMSEEQFAETLAMREATVVLSDRMWNVLFIVADTNVASVIGPPGRLELSGRPY